MCTKTCTRQLETFSIDNVLVFAYLTQFLKTFCCAKMKVGVKWLHTERGTRCDSHPVKLVKGDRNYHNSYSSVLLEEIWYVTLWKTKNHKK